MFYVQHYNTTVLSPAGVINQFPFPLSLPVYFLLLQKSKNPNKQEQYFGFLLPKGTILMFLYCKLL